jgi:hypothetical protein
MWPRYPKQAYQPAILSPKFKFKPICHNFYFFGGVPEKFTKLAKKYKFLCALCGALHWPNWIWQNFFISFSLKPCTQEAGLSYFCPILSQIWVGIGCFWDFQNTRKKALFWLFAAHNLDLKGLYYQYPSNYHRGAFPRGSCGSFFLHIWWHQSIEMVHYSKKNKIGKFIHWSLDPWWGVGVPRGASLRP